MLSPYVSGSIQPSQLQALHHKYLQLQEACSANNRDPSCLASDFGVPARISLTFSTQLLAGVLKNNSYNPEGFAATAVVADLT